MPEGSVVSQEVTVGKPFDDVHRSILLRAVPIFAAAKYKLVSKDDRSVVFERRFLPSIAQRICLVVIVLVVLVQSGNGGEATPALAAGWIAIGAMVFYRRRESLTLDLRSDGEATRLIVVGSLSKKGRAALDRLLGPSGLAAEPQ